jgi:nucleotide-binding universal stress UspA family protein
MNTPMKILICSDGSPQAEQAVRMGATIAAGCQAEVTLFGISESPGESKGLLESLQRSQTILADKKVTAELVNKSGNAIEEIVRRTRETAYSLVVIGAVRKQTGGAFWLSSKSYKIVKEIQPPVLLVAGKGAAIKRILICSGGKRYIDHGVRLTGEIARSLGATVTLLHVMPGIPGILALAVEIGFGAGHQPATWVGTAPGDRHFGPGALAAGRCPGGDPARDPGGRT